MTSRAVELEERLSPDATEFYKALPDDSRDRVRRLIEHIRRNPATDGVNIFPFNAEGISWHVLVAGDYTIFFRPNDEKVLIDSIQRSAPAVKAAAQVV